VKADRMRLPHQVRPSVSGRQKFAKACSGVIHVSY
jgi:hypothetical protein